MSEPRSKYEVLKELLLGEEQAQQAEMERELQRLKEEITVREKLEQNLEPILAERFLRFRREFPQEYRQLLQDLLMQELRENRSLLEEVLRPLIQEMLQKELSQSNTPWEGLKKLARNLPKAAPRKDPTELYQKQPESEEMGDAQVNDVWVFENEGFATLAHYSRYGDGAGSEVLQVLEEEIRAKVQAAVQSRDKGLDWSDYESYKVYLITFKRISVACTAVGVLNQRFKTDLEDRVMDLAKDLLPELEAGNFEYNTKISQRFLANHFRV
jgi:hypothetical protein